ncbi:MAG TPA: hypothetical protein VGR37_18485 [Longimicrobiaceae bacterium]|nr:hypothetical protein [Longimicrobiaceae bacterium]
MFLLACHDDGLGVHNCPTDYSFNWSGHSLKVEHTEPASCPVYIPEPGTERRTGATIVDGGTREYNVAEVRVRDAAGAPLDSKREPFAWDPNNRWAAAPFVGYRAGTLNLRPDIGRFQLYDFAGGPGPWAEMLITYTDRVQIAMQGPGTVAPGSTVTYQAAVTTGTEPFTYRWYEDWDLVGTDQTYTTTVPGDGSIELRVDVTDARGEAASRVRVITVNSCPDGQRVC